MVGFFLSAGCGKPKTQVETEESTRRTLYARVTESGLVQPTIEVPVAPDVSGEVVDLRIIEGSRVKKGDLLLTIRPDDYRALLEQAEASVQRSQASYLQAKASVAQAEATLLQDSVALKRSEELYADKVVSKVDLENAQLRFKVSKAQYDAAAFSEKAAYYQVENSAATRKQARQNLDRTNIYASMDGTITQLNVELGQRVVGTSQMAGTEILKIADLSSMEVLVEVNENDIINVNLSDSARVEIDAFPDQLFYGEVTEIAYSATVAGLASTDQVTNFEVKVKIDPKSYVNAFGESREIGPGESPFRPGMTSLVEIYTQKEENVVVLPIQAVTLREKEDADEASVDEDNQEEVVFQLVGNQVKKIPVKTGISDNTYIHIISGLEDGQEVVTGPFTTLTRLLKEDMEVEKGSGGSR